MNQIKKLQEKMNRRLLMCKLRADQPVKQGMGMAIAALLAVIMFVLISAFIKGSFVNLVIQKITEMFDNLTI